MDKFNIWFISLVLVIFAAQTVFSIQCWECRSDEDPKCADPFDNSTLAIADCAQKKELSHLKGIKATMCRKIRQKIHGSWRYFRSCAYLGEPGIGSDERFCLMRTGTYNLFMEYCTCNSKNGCNSSGIISPNKLNLLITTILLAIGAWLIEKP